MKTLIGNLIILSLLSVAAMAQTPQEAVYFMYDEDGVGIRAQSMGNAYVGLANDYSAIYWNPAGLTQLRTSEIVGSLYHLKFNNEATFAGTTIPDARNFTKLQSLGLAYKFPTTQGSFVLAFGYNRYKNYDEYLYFSGFSADSIDLGFDLEDNNGNVNFYPYDRYVQRTEEMNQDGNLNAWSIGAGLMVSPRLALGVTFDFFSGQNKYMMDFFQDDIDNNYHTYPADYNAYELHDQIISKFSGWGAKLGAMLLLTDDLRAGVTVDFPRSMLVSETYGSNDVLIFDDGYSSEANLADGDWEYVVKYPFKFSGGASLDLGPFTLAGSFEYRDWTQVEFDLPDNQVLSNDYQSLLDDNKLFAQSFRATFAYSAGGEFRLPGTGFSLRAGYRVQPSPIISSGDLLDREYISAGLGYYLDRNTIFNFGYTVGTWNRYSADTFTPSGTTEKIKSEKFLAGLTFRI